MIKLNIALHEGINRPEDHDDDDEIVQATNLWFDAEVDASELLEAIEEGENSMSFLFGECYDNADRYYRIWDNYSPGKHWEDVTDMKDDDFTPDAPLYYNEWHAEVDWDNGKFYSILGSSFSPEAMASPELIAYLKSKVDS